MVEAQESAPIRVVIVSAVRHARQYASAIAADERFCLVGVAEESAGGAQALAEARELAEAHGVPLVDITDVGPDSVDLALVCSEPTRHAALAAAMLEHGLDVLCDKPLATDLAGAARVIQAERSSGRRCAVITRALSPAIQRAVALVESGRLGLPRSVDVEFLAGGTHFATAVERPELVVDRRLSGGGELMNFLGYAIDLLRTVTGCEIVDLFAEGGALFSELHRDARVEDLGVLSVRMTNGVVASILVGRVPVAPAGGAAAFTARLIGSHGSYEFDALGPAVQLDSVSGSRQIHLDQDAVVTVLDDVTRMVREGGQPRYTAADAAVAVSAAIAAMRSLESGMPEPVESVPASWG